MAELDPKHLDMLCVNTVRTLSATTCARS